MDICLTYLNDHIKMQTFKGLYTEMIMLDFKKISIQTRGLSARLL